MQTVVVREPARVTLLKSDKLDFMTQNNMREKQGHLIMTEGLIHKEDITVINVHTPNNNSPNYTKQQVTE